MSSASGRRSGIIWASRLLTAWEGRSSPRIVAPADAEEARIAFAACTDGDHSVNIDLRLGTARGNTRWYRACLSTVAYSEDRLVARGHLFDIQDIKESERKSRALGLKLLESQRMESIGLLAGGIAHDFNNLLMAILGNAGLAMMDVDPESRPYHALQQIELAGTRACELTKELLAYSP